LPEEWKKPIIVPIYKKDDTRTTDCSNYRDILITFVNYVQTLSTILP